MTPRDGDDLVACRSSPLTRRRAGHLTRPPRDTSQAARAVAPTLAKPPRFHRPKTCTCRGRLSIMYTTPEHPLLARGPAIAENAAYISAVCPVLREILNRSVHELDRCATAVDKHADPGIVSHHHITLHLFRQSIVLADAVESLLSHVCIDAAAPMLRSAFETNIGLMYVLNGDNQRGKALAWYYVTVLEYIKSARRRERMNIVPGSVSEWRELSERLLTQEPLKSIQPAYEEEQERQYPKKPQRARPKWYSLFCGPRNVEQLVDEVLGHNLYETYRIFSASVHGRAGMEQTYASFSKPLQIFPIRHVPSSHEDPLILARFGAFLMGSTKRMVDRYLSEEQYYDYLDWGHGMFERMG